MKIAILGFGEAGQMFAKGLQAGAQVRAFDIMITNAMRARAAETGVNLLGDLQNALSGADYIFSLVTADQAGRAAKTAAKFVTPEQIYFEMNSVSPNTKRENQALIASLVDVAIMAPVYPQKMGVPLYISHMQADRVVFALNKLGLNAKAVGDEIGKAAAIKMCRSVMIKGLEALTVESLCAARHYGVEDDVISSLHSSFPQMGWDDGRPDYWFERVATHGRRRAAEMREVAKTVEQAGVLSQMALETSKTQDRFVDDLSRANTHFASWRQLADLRRG